MASAVVWADVVELGRRAAQEFKLGSRLRFEPYPAKLGLRDDGECHRSRRLIRLRLHRSHRPRQPLMRSTIMASLAHELAHLRCNDHDAAHGKLTRQLAQWLKEQGQPVSHVLHTGSARSRRKRRPSFKRAWKDPRPRGRR